MVIWHEQILRILATLTGCDLPLAEIARRALGNDDRMPKIRAWFYREAAARGYSPDVLDQVWHIIEAFGAYGFCRAHAVAFAVPALQSAWLKAHYPAFLVAGLLEHDPGMWPKRVIVADARQHGVPVLPVDINHSQAAHVVEQVDDGTWGVRLALASVRGISDDQVARIASGQRCFILITPWDRQPLAGHISLAQTVPA